jgi:hypothetical protein
LTCFVDNPHKRLLPLNRVDTFGVRHIWHPLIVLVDQIVSGVRIQYGKPHPAFLNPGKKPRTSLKKPLNNFSFLLNDK